MYDIPMEGSAAGDTLALVLIIAPILAAILGYLQKPSAGAFFLALFAGLAVIGIGVAVATQAAPGKGTWLLAAGLGGWGALLSALTAGVTVGARAIASPVPATVPVDGPPAGDAHKNTNSVK